MMPTVGKGPSLLAQRGAALQDVARLGVDVKARVERVRAAMPPEFVFSATLKVRQQQREERAAARAKRHAEARARHARARRAGLQCSDTSDSEDPVSERRTKLFHCVAMRCSDREPDTSCCRTTPRPASGGSCGAWPTPRSAWPS